MEAERNGIAASVQLIDSRAYEINSSDFDPLIGSTTQANLIVSS